MAHLRGGRRFYNEAILAQWRLFNVKRLLVILIFLAAALVACGGSEEVAEPNVDAHQEVTVEAVDLAFTPITVEVPAGQPVKLTLQNNGALEHDFSVMEIEVEGVHEEAGEHDEGSEHTMTVDPELHVAAAAGTAGTVEFTAGHPGTYEFFCSVPGHKEAGMVGRLIVVES
jgi:uncharacterized cupredoxin-like copper-binding protein